MAWNADFFFRREAPRILEDVQPKVSAWTLESLDPAVHGRFGSTSSKILGFLKFRGIFENSRIFISFFHFDCRVSKSTDRRIPGPRVSEIPWTRADPRIPTSVPRESGRWIKRAWPIEPSKSDRGPSNSLRFREAAARFGSLISFRI